MPGQMCLVGGSYSWANEQDQLIVDTYLYVIPIAHSPKCMSTFLYGDPLST